MVDREDGWRYSFTANYWIYDVETKKTRKLSRSMHRKNNTGNGKTQMVVWSPKGHNLAWVKDNDLFVSVDDTEFQITTDGSHNILNGISDWVYEEEILGNGKSTWFSTNGNSLAFVKYDDTLVREYHLQYYASHGAEESSYPAGIDLK